MHIQRRFTILVAVIVALILLGLFVVRSTAFTCWDFRNNLWGPSFLLTHGHSPYRVSTLFELGNAVWMPMVIGLFFPLGFLTLQQASNLWFVFNLVWILLLVWISSGSRRPSVLLFAVAILFTFLFPPMVTHLWSGQISVLITLLFLVIAIWNDRMSVAHLAALIAVGLSKPQLAVLVLPGFLIYRLRHYGVRSVFQLAAWLLAWITALTIPLFLAYPNWIPDFIFDLGQNPSWAHPSTLNFLRQAVPNFGTALWIVLAIVIFALNMWLWIILPNREAIYWSLALTLLITPYIWTWDFVMILPLFISSLFKAQTKLSLGLLLAGYLLCWGLITDMKTHGQVDGSLFWWVPWLLIAFIIGSEYLQRALSSAPKKTGLLHEEQNTS